jgi:hypothetical protein
MISVDSAGTSKAEKHEAPCSNDFLNDQCGAEQEALKANED